MNGYLFNMLHKSYIENLTLASGIEVFMIIALQLENVMCMLTRKIYLSIYICHSMPSNENKMCFWSNDKTLSYYIFN